MGAFCGSARARAKRRTLAKTTNTARKCFQYGASGRVLIDRSVIRAGLDILGFGGREDRSPYEAPRAYRPFSALTTRCPARHPSAEVRGTSE